MNRSTTWRRFVPSPFVALLIAAAFAVRTWGITDPWSTHEWSGEFGAYATGTPARNFFEHGFLETWGVPFTTRIVSADGAVLHWHYLHHPPTYMWFAGLFLKLFGPVEWGLRLLAVLASTAACVAGYVFARRVVGERAARIAACLWAFAPYGLRDGLQLWTEVPIAATSAMALLSYLAWIDDPSRRRLGVLCAWYAAGCLLDWPAHFYGPVFALHALALGFARRDGRFVRAALALFATSIATIAVVALHFVAVVGHERLWLDFHETMSGVSAAPEAQSAAVDMANVFAFWRHQWNGWNHAITGPGAVLVAIGVAALVLARRPRREAALVLLAVAPGLMYVALFPGRSANHLFFLAVSLPAFGALAGAGAEAIARSAQALFGRHARRIGDAVSAVLALAIVFAGITTHAEFRRATADDLLRRLVEHPDVKSVLDDPTAIVFAQPGRGAWLGFHSRAPVWVREVPTHTFERFVTVDLARIEPHRRAIVFVDLTAWEHPALPDELSEHFRVLTEEFDRVARLVALETQFVEITDNFGATSRFGLYRFPTGVGARPTQGGE